MYEFQQPQAPLDRTIRERECRQLTGLCRTTRYSMEKKGTFPARRKLGGRAVGWMLSEIQEWLRLQPKVLPKNLPNERS